MNKGIFFGIKAVARMVCGLALLGLLLMWHALLRAGDTLFER
jgi:hypothetical protein